MAIEDNKRVVTEFFGLLGKDPPAALRLLTDDATWWVAGKPSESPGAGTKDKPAVEQLFRGMSEQFKDGMHITVRSLIAEGDKVAVELSSYAELKSGRVYNNDYHFSITLREGKLCELREYLDTQHVIATFAP